MQHLGVVGLRVGRGVWCGFHVCDGEVGAFSRAPLHSFQDHLLLEPLHLKKTETNRPIVNSCIHKTLSHISRKVSESHRRNFSHRQSWFLEDEY